MSNVVLKGIYKSGKCVSPIVMDTIKEKLYQFVFSTYCCRKESKGRTPQFKMIYQIVREAIPFLSENSYVPCCFWDDLSYGQKIELEKLVNKHYTDVNKG